MSVNAVTKAGWAVAWAKVNALPRLERHLDHANTDHPERGSLSEIKGAARAIIAACEEAEALLDSVRSSR